MLQVLQPHAAVYDAGAQLQVIGYDNTLRADRNLYGQWHFGRGYVVFQRILHQHLHTGRNDLPVVPPLAVGDFDSQGIAETNTLQIEIGFDESQLFGDRDKRPVVGR